MKIYPVFNNSFINTPIKSTTKTVFSNDYEKKNFAKSALEICAVYNIAFGNQGRAIYIIDENRKCSKYKNISCASKETGISARKLQRCLSTKGTYCNQNVIAYAADIEDKDGNIDEIKLNRAMQAFYIKSVYVVSSRGYEKYKTIQDAANALGCSAQTISENINGNRKTAKQRVILKACDIETENEDKIMVPDENEIAKAMNYLRSQRVVVIHKDGSYKIYNTATEASIDNNLASSEIPKILYKERYSANGITAVHEIELVDSDGNIDEVKLNRAMQNFSRGGVYAIQKNGNYKKYLYQKDAVKELGINNDIITKSIQEGIQVKQGYIFAKSSDVEVENKEGLMVVDEEKIKEKIANSTFSSKHYCCPVYLISIEDRSFKKFNSIKEASKMLNISKTGIDRCVLGNACSIKGMIAKKAYDIEKIDEYGNAVLDEKKIDEYIAQAKKALKKRSFYRSNLKK